MPRTILVFLLLLGLAAGCRVGFFEVDPDADDAGAGDGEETAAGDADGSFGDFPDGDPVSDGADPEEADGDPTDDGFDGEDAGSDPGSDPGADPGADPGGDPGEADPGPDEDHPVSCGDDFCDGNAGETCLTCEADCATPAEVCGNGVCSAAEDSASCQVDCGPDPWPSNWERSAQDFLDEINARRLAGEDCPSGPNDPVPALTFSTSIEPVVRQRAWRVAESNSYEDGCTPCNGQSLAELLGEAMLGCVYSYGYANANSTVTALMTTNYCDVVMRADAVTASVGYARDATPSFVILLQ